MKNEKQTTRISPNDPRYKDLVGDMILSGIQPPEQVLTILAKILENPQSDSTKERRENNGKR